MSTKKITLDARMVDSSGIGTYIKNIIPALSASFELRLLGSPAALKNYGTLEIKSFAPPIYSVKEQAAFLGIRGGDLFFSPHYNVPLVIRSTRKRVVTIHDVYHLVHQDQLGFVQKSYARLMLNAAVKLSDRIITVSEFSKEEIMKYTNCPEKKIRVIYNGVKSNRTLVDSGRVKLTYGLPEKYILFVGNIKPNKNLQVLLKAYQLMHPDLRATYKLVIAGKKDGFINGDTGVAAMIASSPELAKDVFFTGYIAELDMDTIYSNASLFVFPSLYEGFGLPPLEAMLNECPVIASDIPSLHEVCGDAALYFDPLDEHELCETMTDVLLDDRLAATLRNSGITRSTHFSWQRSADEHISLLHSV